MFEKVEIGASADDGTGDSLRDAFTKINANFDRLAEMQAQLAAQIADGRSAAAPDWPGEFVARHVAEQAPDVVPPMLGAVWVDAKNRAVYVSVGTETTQDWVIVGQ